MTLNDETDMKMYHGFTDRRGGTYPLQSHWSFGHQGRYVFKSLSVPSRNVTQVTSFMYVD